VAPDFFTGLLVGYLVVAGLPLAVLLVLGLVYPYTVLRLRDSQNRRPDPQLGFKAAMYFFFSLAVLLVLTGLTILVVDFIWDLDLLGVVQRQGRGLFGQRGDFPNPAQRTGLAVLLSGAVFALVHFVVIVTLTRERGPALARRTFLGWRFAVHGLVVLLALTGLLIVLFQKASAPTDEARRFFIGILIVWLPSWFLHFVLLRASSPSPVEPGRLDLGGEED
jgi:hypothetical protein